MWDIVLGQFIQHVCGEVVDDAFPGLPATVTAVLGLNAHYGAQHGVGGVCLVPEVREQTGFCTRKFK